MGSSARSGDDPNRERNRERNSKAHRGLRRAAERACALSDDDVAVARKARFEAVAHERMVD